MDAIIKKFKEYIDIYKKAENFDDKVLYALDIIKYYHFFIIEEKNFSMNMIDDFVANLRLKDSFFNAIENDFYNNPKDLPTFSKEEYLFMKNLLKYIKFENISNNKKITDKKLLLNYLNNSIVKKDMESINIFYNYKLSNSYCLKLTNGKIIILENKNILTLLHEVVHTRVNESKFDEFPSIFLEISLSSYYKLGDYFKRINGIKEFQETTLEKYKKLKNKYYLELLRYVYGLVLSIAFVNINGNNSKNIDKIIEITNNDSEMNVFELLKKLNINENDIINGMNNYKKILTKD